MKGIKMRFNKMVALLLIISYVILLPKNIAQASLEPGLSEKKVLFISSYSDNFLSVPDQKAGIKEVLEPLGIDYDTEYMDTKRFDTKENYILFYEYLTYKLDNVEPYDGIIVGDDNALQFVMDYQNELFQNIPIFFLGINDLNRAKEASNNPFIRGIVEETSIKDNIQIASTLDPNATKIVAIVDNSLTGIGNKEQFYSYQKDFEHLNFHHIDTSEYSFEEIGEVIKGIDETSIILYFSMYVDKMGNNLTIPEAIKILRANTDLPIYRSEIGGIGKGVLGGKMISYYESGKIAALMLVEAMNGKPMDEIESVWQSPNYYTFDYQLLKDYNIDLDLLPKDSILLNREISFFEENKEIVLRTLAFIILLTIMLLILCYDNVRRRKMEKALQESNEELTQTFEELTAQEEELRAQYDTIRAHTEEISIIYQKYSIAIEGTNSAVWEYNIEDNTIQISKNFILHINHNLKEKEDIKTIYELLLTKEHEIMVKEEFQKHIDGEKDDIHIQVPILDQNKNKRWILIRGRGVKDSDDNYKVIHGIFLETTKMKEQDEYIEYLANHDYLTNLPNRMSFVKIINDELYRKNTGTVLLLDIDNFKSINDTLGHMFGDKMLMEISNRFSLIANGDLQVFRFGGDEFLVLLKHEEDLDEIEKKVNHIMSLFEDPIILNNKEYYAKFSIGISRYPIDSISEEQLLMNVDTAMYHVKRNGRNNYMFYHTEMQDEMIQRAKIEDILREAINKDGFKLVYQPQVNVITGEIVGFEALLRLKHHNIPPFLFIEVAEDTGLIKEIGRWVTKEAILQIAKWKREGKEEKSIAINFSSKQMSDIGYYTFLVNLLEENGIEPKYLELEITENILLEKSEATLNFLDKLHKLGIPIALDDFGTGYSSLNYLTYIPVSKIKLDKSLCEKFLGMENLNAMDGLIGLAHSLELEITAEGIEDVEQFKRLKAGGCDYIQGYLFSKPIPDSEIDNIYNKNMIEEIF